MIIIIIYKDKYKFAQIIYAQVNFGLFAQINDAPPHFSPHPTYKVLYNFSFTVYHTNYCSIVITIFSIRSVVGVLTDCFPTETPKPSRFVLLCFFSFYGFYASSCFLNVPDHFRSPNARRKQRFYYFITSIILEFDEVFFPFTGYGCRTNIGRLYRNPAETRKR